MLVQIAYTYDEILTGWDQDVNLFFMWIEIVCGLNRNTDVYKFLQENIHSVADMNDWIQFFDGDFDNIEADTLRYGTWRVCDKTA